MVFRRSNDPNGDSQPTELAFQCKGLRGQLCLWPTMPEIPQVISTELRRTICGEDRTTVRCMQSLNLHPSLSLTLFLRNFVMSVKIVPVWGQSDT